MSVLDDKLDAIIAQAATTEAAQEASITRVTTEVAGFATQITDLQSQIAALQAQIAAGGITPEQQAKLDALQATLVKIKANADGLDPTVPTVIPTP